VVPGGKKLHAEMKGKREKFPGKKSAEETIQTVAQNLTRNLIVTRRGSSAGKEKLGGLP